MSFFSKFTGRQAGKTRLLQKLRNVFSTPGRDKSVPLTRAHFNVVTPKWARGSTREGNRFRRAMNRTETPLVKKAHVVEFAKRGIPATDLARVHENHRELSFQVWNRLQLFTRKRGKNKTRTMKRDERKGMFPLVQPLKDTLE